MRKVGDEDTRTNSYVDTRNADDVHQENLVLREHIQELHRKYDAQTIAINDLHKKLETQDAVIMDILNCIRKISTDTTERTSETPPQMPTSSDVLHPSVEVPSHGPSPTTRNAFPFMRLNMQRLPNTTFIPYKTIEKLCLSTVIIDYYEFELHKVVGKRYPMVDNVNKRKKLNRALNKALSLMNDDEMGFLVEPKPCMENQSTSYVEWKTNLKCLAERVEMRVIVDLFGQEKYDKFPARVKASKRYINSIYDAMSARRDSDGNIIPRSKKRKVVSDVGNL